MRSVALAVLLSALLLCLPSATHAAAPSGGGAGAPTTGTPTTGPAQTLARAMTAGMRRAGADSGAEVLDLSTGAVLYDDADTVPRIPASVEKLYTTTTALETFGPTARLQTAVLGTGHQQGGAWDGTLYLHGGGDPTFGSAAFDRRAYHAGATVQNLVADLRARGIRTVTGPIIADASLFDSEEGTPATGGRPSIYVEGALSALAFNRDWADSTGEVYYAHPALEAGDQLVAALRAAHITVRDPKVRAGHTPPTATPLATAASPSMATLIALTNTPSDNFFAEMLLKDIGAHYGAGGTTAAGAAVVRATIAAKFGLHPYLIDGSGLAYRDHTSPAQVVSLLSQMRDDSAFRDSLSVLGRTGTLLYEDAGTYAAGRCTGKTGTLSDVSNVAGYCTAADGQLLAYALLMNGVDVDAAHLLQDQMQLALARYDG